MGDQEIYRINNRITRRGFLKSIGAIGIASLFPMCLIEKKTTQNEVEITRIIDIFRRLDIKVEPSVFKTQPPKPLILLDYSPSNKLEMNSCTMETEKEANEKAETLRQKDYHTFIYIPEAPGEKGSIVTEEIKNCEHTDRRLYLLTHEALHHSLEDIERDWRETIMLEEASTHCLSIKLAKTVANELYGTHSEEYRLLENLDNGYRQSAPYLKKAGEAFKTDKKLFQELTEKAYSYKTFSGGCGKPGASEYNPNTYDNTVRFAISYTQSLYPLFEELIEREGYKESFKTIKESMTIASEKTMRDGITYIEDILRHTEKEYSGTINIWGHHKTGAEINCNNLANLV